MALVGYPALIEEAEGGGFGVSFPDFPGCVSFAEDFAWAGPNAHEALQLHIQGMAEDGVAAPTPRPIRPPEQAGLAMIVVRVSVPEVKDAYVRLNITLPEPLVHQIDEAAQGNRSGWLAQAADEKLRRSHG